MTPEAEAVLLYLNEHPSVDFPVLALALDMTEDTVLEALEELDRAGFLQIDPRH